MRSAMARAAALAVVLAVGLGACNTLQGMGRDLERTGEVIQDKAKR